MKRFFIVALCLLAVVACERKKKASTINVENTVSDDKAYMESNYDGKLTWFESTVTLSDYLDSGEELSVETVTNIFQVTKQIDESYDTHVIMATHNKDGVDRVDHHGFWFDDQPLEDIAITFTQALERLNQANLPKPHSVYCVLRKELGPVSANPQYIFGNTKSRVYVDAITGNVTDINPVYPAETK